MTLKFMQARELCRQSKGSEISELLRYAAELVEAGNLGAACWRLADAGQMLRQRMTRKGFSGAEGLDIPTGRGAVLPGAQNPPDVGRASTNKIDSLTTARSN